MGHHQLDFKNYSSRSHIYYLLNCLDVHLRRSSRHILSKILSNSFTLFTLQRNENNNPWIELPTMYSTQIWHARIDKSTIVISDMCTPAPPLHSFNFVLPANQTIHLYYCLHAPTKTYNPTTP